MFNLHQTISQLVSSSGVSVQSKSRLKAIKTPCASLALSFRTASKESGKIFKFLISWVNQDDVWFCRVDNCYGRPWPAVYINFVLKIHQIQVLTEPLCRAQASFYALPNNERGTKYRGLTYSARQNCP